MRAAIGGLMHETNTFANARTTLDDFRAYQFARGGEMLARYAHVRNEIGGMMAGAREIDLELAPTLFCFAVPSGMVTRETYQQLAAWLLEDLARIDFDGVLLALHGAMVAEDAPDAEGDLLRRVRALVGDKPIVATFDMHANLSAAMCECADVWIGYDTYPHVDVYERGVEAARVMAKILRGEIRPTTAFERLPLLSVPQAQYTDASPMREIMARRAEMETDARVVTASVAVGFPYADVTCAGMSVVVTTNADADLAKACARELREMIWARRDAFVVKNTPVAEAVSRAIHSAVAPVILVDVADNIGGGAPGDGTILLSALLDARAQNAVVTIADAEAVALAIDAGIGNFVSLRVGGKTDSFHGEPVQVHGRVRLISSGEYVHKGSYMTGTAMRMGRTVVLDCAGIDVVLMEHKTMPFDAQQLRSLGLEPADKKIIVVKSAIAWQAAYGEMARAVFYVDTPGICTANLKTLPYQNVRRPMFPLDDISW
jgi:microcystin degradation protein MlrC